VFHNSKQTVIHQRKTCRQI